MSLHSFPACCLAGTRVAPGCYKSNLLTWGTQLIFSDLSLRHFPIKWWCSPSHLAHEETEVERGFPLIHAHSPGKLTLFHGFSYRPGAFAGGFRLNSILHIPTDLHVRGLYLPVDTDPSRKLSACQNQHGHIMSHLPSRLSRNQHFPFIL